MFFKFVLHVFVHLLLHFYFCDYFKLCLRFYSIKFKTPQTQVITLTLLPRWMQSWYTKKNIFSLHLFCIFVLITSHDTNKLQGSQNYKSWIKKEFFKRRNCWSNFKNWMNFMFEVNTTFCMEKGTKSSFDHEFSLTPRSFYNAH